MTEQTRQPAGVPVGGQFATTGRAEPATNLSVAPVTAVEEDMNAAWDQLNAAREVIAKGTTHLIASDLLRVSPDAAYLELNEENEENCYRVRSGALLDVDGDVLLDDLGDFDPDSDNDLWTAVDEQLQNFRSLDDAEGSPAVSDPMVNDEQGRPSHRQHRIDLKAALAFYPLEETR